MEKYQIKTSFVRGQCCRREERGEGAADREAAAPQHRDCCAGALSEPEQAQEVGCQPICSQVPHIPQNPFYFYTQHLEISAFAQRCNECVSFKRRHTYSCEIVDPKESDCGDILPLYFARAHCQAATPQEQL